MIAESDRAIVKAMTFRSTDLVSGPRQDVEDMAQYVAAYREACVKAERERVLAEVADLSHRWHRLGLGIDCCECSTDHYDCGNEADALIAKLRRGP